MNSWSVGLLNLDSAFIGEGSLAHFGFSCSLWVLGLLYFFLCHEHERKLHPGLE
jgi:hypothetical protein